MVCDAPQPKIPERTDSAPRQLFWADHKDPRVQGIVGNSVSDFQAHSGVTYPQSPPPTTPQSLSEPSAKVYPNKTPHVAPPQSPQALAFLIHSPQDPPIFQASLKLRA